VPGAAEGERVVAGLVAGDFASTRSPLLLEHLDASDVVVVLHGDAVVAADAAAVRATARAVELPTDPLTPVAVLDEPPAGERVGDAGVAARWRTEGTVLSAAMAAGIARATTDLAVAYATERYQFDRPIGSFQAIKHILADMLVRSEVARAAADAAAVLLDDPEAGDAERAVAAAKVVAGDAAVRNAEACIQVHGGMGFTWEAQPHFFLKRAWVLDADFGSADVHAEAIAAARPSR
jgi:alkylation response protein AidB-like acyl-CoA dehydrogenase